MRESALSWKEKNTQHWCTTFVMPTSTKHIL